MTNPHDGEHLGWLDDIYEGFYDEDDYEFWAG